MLLQRPTSPDTTGQQGALDTLASKLQTAIASITASARKAANVALIGGAALGVVAGCGDDNDNGRTIYGEGGTGGETTSSGGGGGAGGETTNTGGGGTGGETTNTGGGGAGGGTITGLKVCTSVPDQADWEDFVRNEACNLGAVSDCQKMPNGLIGIEFTNQFAVINCREDVDLNGCILVVYTPNGDPINWAVAADKGGATSSQSYNVPQEITFEAGETKMRAAGKVDGKGRVFSDCQ